MVRVTYDMAERSSALESTRLLLEILKRIPKTGRKVTAGDLHKALQEYGLKRHKRTIERMLEMLTEHFDIECDNSSKPYGYCWKPNAKGLSFPTLNAQESLLLTLAQRYLKNLLPQHLLASMDGFFEQARKNLLVPGMVADAKRASSWLTKVRVVDVSQPLLPPSIEEGVLEAVSKALFQGCWLTVDYQNAAGVEGKYRVMPLGLVQQGPFLYLVCRYEGYDNERNLAIHRIIKAEASDLTFERPAAFDLEKYDQDGRFGFGEGKRIVLSFNIDKDAGHHLLEAPLSEDQQVEDHGHSYTITATVVDADRLVWWLRGFGRKVRRVSKVPVPEAASKG